MDRRQFLHLTAAGIGGAMLNQGCRTTSGWNTTDKRPNIVFLLADQLRYQSCGYAGDKRAVTPNIDRLAQEGMNFRQTVSSMPVCSAYRASLLTGKYVTSTGMVINELRMNPNHRCLGHVLTEAGYETGYIGKWHLYANQLGRHHNPKNSFVPRGKHRLGFNGYWAAYNFHHDYYDSYYHTESPEKIYYGDDIFEPDAQTELAIDYINQHRADDKPFCLVVSYGTPHDPWVKSNVPEKFYEMFNNIKFEVPPNYSAQKDPYGDQWSNIDHNSGKLDEWMRNYYAMTANLDRNVGRIQQAIVQAGLDDDTIIVFTSDHGEMFGAQGRMKKNIFYEESVRVPMLMRWKGTIPSGSVSDCCLNTPDIMPTLLGLAGLEKRIPVGVEGMDVSRTAKGHPGSQPDAAYLFNTGACAIWEDGHEWRAVRDRQYTYGVFRGGGPKNLPRKEMLFDNTADPYQMNNLIDLTKYQKLAKRLRKILNKKMTELNDTFPASTWYRKHWTDGRRNILRGARG